MKSSPQKNAIEKNWTLPDSSPVAQFFDLECHVSNVHTVRDKLPCVFRLSNNLGQHPPLYLEDENLYQKSAFLVQFYSNFPLYQGGRFLSCLVSGPIDKKFFLSRNSLSPTRVQYTRKSSKFHAPHTSM